MGFIESYKRLEKLCGEILGDERCISAYIDEMLNTSRGSSLISGWDDDLKNLKHYRWVRNKIAHEPNCTEQNMCNPNDVEWLENFYLRIMKQNDPLALYLKATKNYQTTKSKQPHKIKPSQLMGYSQPLKPKKTNINFRNFVTLLFRTIFIIILIHIILRLFSAVGVF